MTGHKTPDQDPAFALHLSFNGNCRQAFHYYQDCFGGELVIQTLADTPAGDRLDSEMQQIVIWASLNNKYFRLAGTDLTDEENIVAGNNLGILVACSSVAERTRLVNRLIGRNYCSFEYTNPLINLVDKYRIRWIFHIHL